MKTYPLLASFLLRILDAFVPPRTGRPGKAPRRRTKSPALDASASRLTSPRLLLSTRSDTPQCTPDTSAAEPAVCPSQHIGSHHATSYVGPRPRLCVAAVHRP